MRRGLMMKKLIMSSLLFCSMMFFVAGSAFAVKPGADGDPPVNPNGFPAGVHFNLNIHGKKIDFSCPDPYSGPDYNGETHSGKDYGKYVSEGTEEDPIWVWKYSGSLFIPEGTVENPVGNIKILIETGKSGGKGKKNNALVPDSLVVTDPCTFDDGEAKFQLPPAKNGYWVFFRALAKPTDDPSLTIEDAGVNFFEDKDGNVLLFYAGSLGKDFVDSTTNKTLTITRSKGKSVAMNVTDLFNFSGNICFFDAEDCPGELGVDCLETPLCCELIDNGDGTFHYDNCVLNDTDTNGDGFVDGLDCNDGTTNVGLEPVVAFCKEFVNESIFNIADFVQFFYDLKNGGLKLLQVRFYPIPDAAS
jgi:hypothetical protein